METPLPNPDKLNPLNVNESRAKRLERQHARMRDRGGYEYDFEIIQNYTNKLSRIFTEYFVPKITMACSIYCAALLIANLLRKAEAVREATQYHL